MKYVGSSIYTQVGRMNIPGHQIIYVLIQSSQSVSIWVTAYVSFLCPLLWKFANQCSPVRLRSDRVAREALTVQLLRDAQGYQIFYEVNVLSSFTNTQQVGLCIGDVHLAVFYGYPGLLQILFLAYRLGRTNAMGLENAMRHLFMMPMANSAMAALKGILSRSHGDS